MFSLIVLFSLDLFACPLCKENVYDVTNLRIYIACCNLTQLKFE